MHTRKLVVILGVWFAVAACGGSTPSSEGSAASPVIDEPSASVAPPVGTLRVSDSSCSMEGPSGPIAPGVVTFAAVNETEGLAAFNIAAIGKGHSFQDLASHIEKEIELAEAGKPGLGHPSFAVPLFEILLGPGESGTMSGTIMDTGKYGLSCARLYDEVGELRPAGALGPVTVR